MGVLYLMSKAYSHLRDTVKGSQKAQVEHAKHSLLAAALLHDVGHGPFSHLFEPCMGINHEYWSIRIISDPESCIHRKLSKVYSNLPTDVCELIKGDKPSLPRWEKSLISSQLDMDRMDYLRRDSLFSGAGYGHFDWSRLITTMELHENDNESIDLVWPEKASMSIEEYIFARYYMYQNVYLHKTTRGFEVLLQAMWKRAKTLIDEGSPPELIPAIEKLWLNDPDDISVAEYLAVEEHSVLYQMQAWTSSTDSVLKDLATRFLNRDGFAMIDPPPVSDPLTEDRSEWESKVADALNDKDFKNASCYCLKDELKAKYLSPYRPEPEKGLQDMTNAIFIKSDNGQVLEVSESLPRLKAVIEMGMSSSKFKYYVPKSMRKIVQNIK